MVDKAPFIQAFIVLCVAVLGDLYILSIQVREIRKNHILKGMKWMLAGLMLFLLTAVLPLMYIYADIIWGFNMFPWIVNFAVLTNAYSKLAIVAMLILIYTYRGGANNKGKRP